MENEKKFVKPNAEIIAFDDADIITSSDPSGIGDVNDSIVE